MPFAYFGRKGKLAPKYPTPQHGTIIEPFAGSAAYSLYGNHWENRVILVELDDRVVRLWDWFINDATEDDFLNLPNYIKGDSIIGNEPIMDVIRLGAVSENWKGKSVFSSWMARDWNKYRRRLVKSLPKIRHWEIIQGNYTLAPDIAATWFIDPPYQPIEIGYGRNTQNKLPEINYKKLGAWSKTRKGLTIVCEKEGADWLPFEFLYSAKTLNNTKIREVVWLAGNQRNQRRPRVRNQRRPRV